jgi:3-oxoacyl-[acyl-carrier protein] reductase
VVNGRHRQAIDDVVQSITAEGATAIGVSAYVTVEKEVQRLRQAAEGAFGTVDIVCACAGGYGDPFPLTEVDVEAWKAGIDANLTSAYLAFREFIPSMADQGRGAIVTIASTAGRVAAPSSPAYAAAKAGLIMLSRHSALEYAEQGVRINTIALGPVFDGKAVPPDVEEQVGRLHPLQRTGHQADVAAAALFLVSDASAWLTGITLDLSGGRVMM